MLKTLLAAVVSALALVAAGCGDSSGSESPSSSSEAVEWADGFCTAITTWTDSLKQVGKDLARPSSLNQQGLDQAANDARMSTQDLIDTLRGLGAPKTASGQDVKNALDELSTTLDDELTRISDTTEGVSGLSDILGAVASVTKSVAAMSAALSSTYTTIDNADVRGDLRKALDDTPSCADIPGLTTG